MSDAKAKKKRKETEDDDEEPAVHDDEDGKCSHGVREDDFCTACQADGCPGGGSCGCPGNVPRSRRHLFSSRH